MSENFINVETAIKNSKVNKVDYIRFDKLSKDEVERLHEIIGYAYGTNAWLESTQNDSPEVQEFLALCDEFDGKLTLHGYIILLPRSDYRVSIEGFEGSDLSAEETLELMDRYGHADEKNFKRIDNWYYVYFWWD